MRFCVLASGSKGNAVWIETAAGAVLVDCGLSGRECKARLADRSLDPARLTGILVSHEHRDHALGAGIISRAFRIPLYINSDTLDGAAPMIGSTNVKLFRTGGDLKLGGLVIHPFSTSHDAADPVGFTFDADGVRLGLATDLGSATQLVRNRLAGMDALILESNHDPDMLQDGPYPWELKRRVKSRTGHLSNPESAELLAALSHSGLRRVVLAHLSETNNLPELALETARSAWSGPPENLIAAGQSRPTPVFEV